MFHNTLTAWKFSIKFDFFEFFNLDNAGSTQRFLGRQHVPKIDQKLPFVPASLENHFRKII